MKVWVLQRWDWLIDPCPLVVGVYATGEAAMAVSKIEPDKWEWVASETEWWADGAKTEWTLREYEVQAADAATPTA